MIQGAYEYFDIILQPRLPNRKTDTYTIHNKDSGEELGRIIWYGAWRKYCFVPKGDTVWDTKCLEEVNRQIKRLMDAR